MAAFIAEVRGFIADLNALHDADPSTTKPGVWSFMYEAFQAYRAYKNV